MIRAFLALPLPEALSLRLLPVQAALRLPRPVPPEQLHVTLVFLGEQREDVLEDVHHALSTAWLVAPELLIEGLGWFESGAAASVHAKVRPEPNLVQLQGKVAQAVRGAGIDLPRRRFLPHVTLGRGIRGDMGAYIQRFRDVGPVRMGPERARTLTLYRSRLRPEGALYDSLADYPLREAQDA